MPSGGTVLVTGAAHRIGAAIARRFGSDGRKVLIHYNSSKQAAEILAAELPASEAISWNLANSIRCEAGVRRIADANPDWDTLILSASLFEPDWAPDYSSETLKRAMGVNLSGNLALQRAFLRATDRSLSRTVVVLLDQKLANLNPDFFSYTLSKGALEYAVRMLAMQLSTSADRVYGVAPGLTQPSHDQTEAEFEQAATRNLLVRRNRPEEVAEAVHFAARRVLTSGTILYADSGQHLMTQDRDVMYAVRQES